MNWAKEKEVALLWVPGNSDVEGNEEFDDLAKRRAIMPVVGPVLGKERVYPKITLRKKESKKL